MKAIVAMLCDDSGAAMVEYAVILALLTLVSLAIFATIATSINTTLDTQQTSFSTVQQSP
jgi:Flp pilus assembly pilin Flp